MLFYAKDPPSAGYALNLANACAGLVPPDYHGTLPEEYVGFLRTSFKKHPRPFVDLVRKARAEDLTLVSMDRMDLVEVLSPLRSAHLRVPHARFPAAGLDVTQSG